MISSCQSIVKLVNLIARAKSIGYFYCYYLNINVIIVFEFDSI